MAEEIGWDDSALKGIFVNSLSDFLKDQLATRDEPDSLDGLISLAIRLDNRLRERRHQTPTRLCESILPDSRQYQHFRLNLTNQLHLRQNLSNAFGTLTTFFLMNDRDGMRLNPVFIVGKRKCCKMLGTVKRLDPSLSEGNLVGHSKSSLGIRFIIHATIIARKVGFSLRPKKISVSVLVLIFDALTR